MRETLLAHRSDSATLLMNTIPLPNDGSNHKARAAPEMGVNININRTDELEEDERVRCTSVE